MKNTLLSYIFNIRLFLKPSFQLFSILHTLLIFMNFYVRSRQPSL